MRRDICITTATLLLLLGTSGCNDILDVTPKDQFPDQAVFADPNLAEAFLNDIYRGLGHGLYEIMLASLADETHFIHVYGTDKIVQAVITSSDRGALDDGRFAHFNWGPNYSRIPQDRAALWRAAKNAAQAVTDLGIYSLFRPSPANAQEAAKNYGDLFLQTMSQEVILSRFFLSTRDDGYNPGLHNGPNGFHTWGGNTPIQNLVDDYRMADGSKFDWGNAAEAAAPYANRDPRFYASIAYDGAPWRPRPDDVKDLDSVGMIQTFRQLAIRNDSGRVTDVVPGLDTRDSPVENWNGAYSGYYLRKFVDPSINAQFIKEQLPWIFS